MGAEMPRMLIASQIPTFFLDTFQVFFDEILVPHRRLTLPSMFCVVAHHTENMIRHSELKLNFCAGPKI